MADPRRVADDFVDGIGPVTFEIFGQDTAQNRRKVYRQFELPEDQRLKGIFKISERRVACVPSVVRADLERRALAAPSLPAQRPAASAQS